MNRFKARTFISKNCCVLSLAIVTDNFVAGTSHKDMIVGLPAETCCNTSILVVGCKKRNSLTVVKSCTGCQTKKKLFKSKGIVCYQGIIQINR